MALTEPRKRVMPNQNNYNCRVSMYRGIWLRVRAAKRRQLRVHHVTGPKWIPGTRIATVTATSANGVKS